MMGMESSMPRERKNGRKVNPSAKTPAERGRWFEELHRRIVETESKPLSRKDVLDLVARIRAGSPTFCGV